MGTFIETIRIFFNFLEILILVRVFLTIFRISFSNPIGNIIYQLTEPIIIPGRFIVNKLGLDKMMIDFSPWIGLLIIRLVHTGIIQLVMAIWK